MLSENDNPILIDLAHGNIRPFNKFLVSGTLADIVTYDAGCLLKNSR